VRGGALAGISPEGMVGHGEALQPGQKGVARIALAAGAPVIPVAIWGTQLRWPKDGLKWSPPLRPTVALHYAPPVMPKGDPANRSDVRAMTDRIMAVLEDAVASARVHAEGRSPASEARAV